MRSYRLMARCIDRLPAIYNYFQIPACMSLNKILHPDSYIYMQDYAAMISIYKTIIHIIGKCISMLNVLCVVYAQELCYVRTYVHTEGIQEYILHEHLCIHITGK